ncbi:MAG: hypothetical protein WBP56_21075, partial [Polyangia bacterium]
MIASAISERMGRKLDYAPEENRILKEALRAATGKERIAFTPAATILAWFRQLAARKYDSSRRKTGRPRKPRDIRKLVIDLALANEG